MLGQSSMSTSSDFDGTSPSSQYCSYAPAAKRWWNVAGLATQTYVLSCKEVTGQWLSAKAYSNFGNEKKETVNQRLRNILFCTERVVFAATARTHRIQIGRACSKFLARHTTMGAHGRPGKLDSQHVSSANIPSCQQQESRGQFRREHAELLVHHLLHM